MSSKKPKFKQHASNYNYKGKRSFGQRIKNFFTIPEEDLKEEPSKEFEKIKLFTLTRGSLFLGILVFMILINILVGFNINFLYIRQILGFLFLILIPGLLIMLCFKIRTVKFWEYLVYTVGLSIAFIMFAGLAVNWTLPALNITDKPLSLWPILICFDIFLLGLWLTAIYRNRDLKPFDITIPKLDNLNRIFFIIPMIFPLLSILGAFLLNNHGPNILTMIMLGGIAVYVLLLVIFRKHMNENVWPWALWMIGLSLLLMWSLAGWNIPGWDSRQEYLVFKLTDNANFWSMNLYQDSYNACISINILPKIFLNFTHINQNFIFKLFFQILFSFISIILFLVFKKIGNSTFSFLSTLFFFSNIQFIMYSGWIRQEFSLLFFALSLLTLFFNKDKFQFKSYIFILFGFSMVISHYSTTYISLFILISFLITSLFFNKKKNELSQNYLMIIILLILSFLWMFQITHVSNDLIVFTENSLSHFDEFMDKSNLQSGVSILDQLKLSKSYKTISYKEVTSFYNKIGDIYLKDKNINVYSNSTYSNFKIVLSSPPLLPIKEPNIYRSVLVAYNVSTLLPKILLVLGLFLFLFFYKNKNSSYLILSLISFLLIISITLIPFASINYSARRLYQQLLLILSPLIIFPFLLLNKPSKHKIAYIFLSIFLIFLLLFSSGFVQEIVGGFQPSHQLSGNRSSLILEGFTYSEEVYSANWLSKNINSNFSVYGNNPIRLKLMENGVEPKFYIDIFPNTMDKNSYVFPSYANVKGISSLSGELNFQKRIVYYEFPNEFLNENKNKIYNNGGSEIFK